VVVKKRDDRVIHAIVSESVGGLLVLFRAAFGTAVVVVVALLGEGRDSVVTLHEHVLVPFVPFPLGSDFLKSVHSASF
jgi:hypothetical protein